MHIHPFLFRFVSKLAFLTIGYIDGHRCFLVSPAYHGAGGGLLRAPRGSIDFYLIQRIYPEHGTSNLQSHVTFLTLCHVKLSLGIPIGVAARSNRSRPPSSWNGTADQALQSRSLHEPR